MMDGLYRRCAGPLLRMGLRVLSVVRPKLRDRLREESAAHARVAARPRRAPRIHMHAASMGELEQCLPVMHALRHHGVDAEIIVTCTAPSGYAHARRCREVADVCYLPVDGPAEMAALFDAVRADVIMIDRYDVWPMFMAEAQRRGIPVVLINATYPSAATSRIVGGMVRTAYEQLHSITAVSAADAEALSTWLGRTITTLPDTRMDRVLERIASPDPRVLALRRTTAPTIILGSCWPPDEEIVFDAMAIVNDPSVRLVIVPHEPTEDALKRIERRLPVTRLSVANASTTGHILVDSVGHLLSLYAIADAAYVGGGFGVGVHSLAEPAGYGIPLACGPAIERSRDGSDLVAIGACSIIRSVADAAAWISSVVLNAQVRADVGSRARDYVHTRSGAAEQHAIHIASLINGSR